MPKSSPYEHPISDLLAHGMRPFPRDIDQLVRAIDRLDHSVLEDPQLRREALCWQKGQKLDEARQLLGAKLRQLTEAGEPD